MRGALSPLGIVLPEEAHSLSLVQMEQELYESDAWKNATPEQRIEFIAKVRAIKRIEKERIAKQERQKKIDAKTPAKPSVASNRRNRKRNKRERKKLRSSGVLTKTSKKSNATVFVAGTDVTSDAFLQTYEWRKVRMEALKKYGPKCMCCGATPATGAVMNVDHIKPRKLFPQLALDIDNLQILCHDCNHGKGNWDQTDWRPTALPA